MTSWIWNVWKLVILILSSEKYFCPPGVFLHELKCALTKFSWEIFKSNRLNYNYILSSSCTYAMQTFYQRTEILGANKTAQINMCLFATEQASISSFFFPSLPSHLPSTSFSPPSLPSSLSLTILLFYEISKEFERVDLAMCNSQALLVTNMHWINYLDKNHSEIFIFWCQLCK